jgi:hypothetical protein
MRHVALASSRLLKIREDQLRESEKNRKNEIRNTTEDNSGSQAETKMMCMTDKKSSYLEQMVFAVLWGNL